jgi:hypothetical protein
MAVVRNTKCWNASCRSIAVVYKDFEDVFVKFVVGVITGTFSNAIGYAKFYSRSHDAVIRPYNWSGLARSAQ